MADFLKEQSGDIPEYDDKLVRQLVEKVLIYDDKLAITFKSGLDTEIVL